MGASFDCRGEGGARFTVDDGPWLREQVGAGRMFVVDSDGKDVVPPPWEQSETAKPARKRTAKPAKSAAPQSDSPDTD